MMLSIAGKPKTSNSRRNAPRENRGWLRSREDDGHLRLTRTRFDANEFRGASTTVDPRAWLRIGERNSLRSCCGDALATCMEVVAWWKSGGGVVRLSRAFAYLTAQKLSGSLGRDVGATVCGAVKAAKVFGVCREKCFPTGDSYHDDLPPAAVRNAAKCRAVSHSLLGDYDDVAAFLGAGLGAAMLAIPWQESLALTDGVVTEAEGEVLAEYVVSIVGIDEATRDVQGRPYLVVANSEGRAWGRDGFASFAPQLFDDWGSRREVLMVGLSDLYTYEIRNPKHEAPMSKEARSTKHEALMNIPVPFALGAFGIL